MACAGMSLVPAYGGVAPAASEQHRESAAEFAATGRLVRQLAASRKKRVLRSRSRLRQRRFVRRTTGERTGE